jgi:sugar lactone lactonase YvrE
MIYLTREAAERQIAEDTMERIQQYLSGERDFEDAMTVEEYVIDVDVLPDGSVVDEDGNLFGKDNW